MGAFELDQGGTVRGVEQWILFPNSKLQARPGFGGIERCAVVWTVQGKVGPPVSCATCTLGLALTATLSKDQTTCPEGLVKRDATMALAYDVERRPDGTSRWFFSESGRALGEGYHEGLALNYLSDPQCEWF